MSYRLSILVVAKNEEKQIANCLETLSFGDEIVVILDSCKDNTKKIAQKYTKIIFSGSWKNEGERRNYGISKCKSEWILEIDADERVSEFLSREIKEVIRISKYDYHHIPVMNYIGKDPVKFGWGAYFGKSAYPGLFKRRSKMGSSIM